jgi:hypothetical protein
MKFGAMLQRLHHSFQNSAGTVVFGMEDGTVSIFGLIFGVAATTSNPKTVLIAGASGAVAAAVSMMAGSYLDIETTRDKAKAARLAAPSAAEAAASLPPRLAKAGLNAAASRRADCAPSETTQPRPVDYGWLSVARPIRRLILSNKHRGCCLRIFSPPRFRLCRSWSFRSLRPG